MKKVRTALILMALMTAIIITITSCENPIDSSVQYGSLSVDVSDDGSRTIQPETFDLAFSKYRIYGSHKEHSELTVDQEFTTSSIQINDLLSGEWSFRIEGYNEKGILLATSDEETVDIAVNGVTRKTYKLDWLKDGEGTLSLSIAVQSSRVSKVECLLENAADGSTSTLTMANGNLQTMYRFDGVFTVSTGQYTATITMKDADGNKIGSYLHQSVHVYRNLVSRYDFSWEKFSNLLPVDAPAVGVADDEAIDCNSTLTLTTEESDTNIFYSFDGDTYAEYEGAIDIASYCNKESLTLYAYAVKNKMKNSEVASYTYSVSHVGTAVEDESSRYFKAEATCEESAVYYKSCSSCGNAVTETFYVGTPLGHDKINHEPQASTCTVQGWNAYDTCSRCDYTTKELLPLIAHDETEVVDPQYLKSSATCVDKAVYYKSCSMCGKASTETFNTGEALGHDKINHEALPSTCTVQGWDSYDTCTRCDYTTKELLPLIAHNEVEVEDSRYLKSEATCTESAVYYRSCSVCGNALSTTFTVGSPLGHDYVDHESKNPTCTSVGWNAYLTCSRCEYTTYSEIEALGHDNIEKISSNYLLSDATCTESAVYYKSCSRCEIASTETFSYGNPLGHDYQNYKCSRCSLWTTGPAGGYVFYDCDADNTESDPDGADDLLSTECGWRYLEAAPTDLDTRYCFGYFRTTPKGAWESTGETYKKVGSGKSNTEILIAYMGDEAFSKYDGTGTSLYAAKACDNYSVVVEGSVYDDWFLPSSEELLALYENLHQTGLISLDSYDYWSSTEYYSGTHSYYLYVGSGTVDGYEYREHDNNIRPVRAFMPCADGMVHDWNEGVVTTEPTCFNFGKRTYTCESCGIKKTEIVSKLSHNFVDYKCTYCLSWGGPGPAGGYVFYDCDADNDTGNADGLISSECGWRYLEAAPNDLDGYFIFGGDYLEDAITTTQTAIGTGKSNTSEIINKLGDGNYAAKACADFECNGFSDWFLPSKDELVTMYKNVDAHLESRWAYGSSTEVESGGGYYGYTYALEGSKIRLNYRNDDTLIRPIRAFLPCVEGRTDHNETEIIDPQYLKNEATCTEPATYYKVCSACNKMTGETFTVGSALGHDYVDYKCTRCSLWSKGPAEGYVFYDCDADNNAENDGAGPDGLKSSECGWRYLEAAPNDLASSFICFGYYRTSSGGSNLLVGTSTALGTGENNTKKLVEAISYSYTNVYAAKECADFSLEADGTTYSDWFLPSEEELCLMYDNLGCKGIGNFRRTIYLSSSEYDSDYAWIKAFYTGDQYKWNRDSYASQVRPVRTFL